MTTDDKIAQDAALMKDVAMGKRSACRQLTDNHLRHAVRLAYRIVGNNAQAEDVAQEAFVRLWKQAAKWQPKAQIKTWLHRVVHNLCVDLLRKEKRYSDGQMPEIEDPALDVIAVRQQKQVSDMVNDALQQLPSRQRIAISLVHYEGCGNIEAARIMTVSVDALESLLARGRRKLKQLLLPAQQQMKGN